MPPLCGGKTTFVLLKCQDGVTKIRLLGARNSVTPLLRSSIPFRAFGGWRSLVAAPRMIFEPPINTLNNQNAKRGHQVREDQEIRLHASGLAAVHVISAHPELNQGDQIEDAVAGASCGYGFNFFGPG